MGKKVLVTGATGFLGRHILNELVDHSVLALVRKPQVWKDYDWTDAYSNVDLLTGGLDDVSSWQNDSRLDDVHGIFHLAGLVRHSRMDSEDVYETNIQGTLNMVRLAARLKCRMVYISTSGTVGCFKNEKEWADESAPYCEKKVKNWPYYHSKILAEKKAMTLAKDLGVELVIIRPPVLLGPGDHRFRATGHVTRLLQDRLPFLFKGGIHFIDIRDAAAATVKAMFIEKPQIFYHLQGMACPIDEFFEVLGQISGKKPPKLFVPVSVAWVLSVVTQKLDKLIPGKGIAFLPDPVVIEMASQYWDVKSRFAKRDLGYESRDAKETLRDTVLWLTQHHPELKQQEWNLPVVQDQNPKRRVA